MVGCMCVSRDPEKDGRDETNKKRRKSSSDGSHQEIEITTL